MRATFPSHKLGIIAGNGRFLFIVLDAPRAQGYEVVVAAINRETSPKIESNGAIVPWLTVLAGHSCPTVAANSCSRAFRNWVKRNTKVKGVGQECPTHTG